MESMQVTKSVRAAVIGAGYLGTYHAEKYHSLPDVDLVAVVDVVKTQAERIAALFGVDAFTDYRHIFGEVDLVSIATPTEQHYLIARDCLESGIHTLVEKPITQTVEEAQILTDLAQAKGVVLQVGHLERFNPAMQAIQGQLKNPRFIESHRLSPYNFRGTDVDVVMDLMIHDIDIILSIVASPLINIQSTGMPILTSEVDIANARLEFANGCVANVTASRVSGKRMRKFRVFQSNAYIAIDFGEHNLFICRKDKQEKPWLPEQTIKTEEYRFENSDALLDEISAFIHSIRNDSPPVVSGLDGMRALEVAQEINRAIKCSPYNQTLVNEPAIKVHRHSSDTVLI